MGRILPEEDYCAYKDAVKALKSVTEACIETAAEWEKICEDADAFYGDPGMISERMRYLKKSVMIANIEI